MLTLKKGRKLNKAFKIYTCSRCGYEGITCDNDDIVNHKHGTKYAEELYSKETKLFEGYDLPHTICPNCGQSMGYTLYTEQMDEEYIKKLVGVSVTLENRVRTILTEDDLFY